MTLIPQTGEPGYWRNPAWSEGTPGVFALIIGVSEYLHLLEDQNSLQMGSLHVSALTAFRFFEWLGSLYELEGVPLASCRLLLSPTDRETSFEPLLAQHCRTAFFEDCENAIGSWFEDMRLLPALAAKDSRSIFFFSGHGLEITNEMQVLLPHDYLKPPIRNYNRAIGTDNLRKGLKALRVNRHFFFLDACRNDHDNLKQVEPIEGAKILNPVIGSARNSKCYVPLFFSSAAGGQSFQPKDPGQGVSLFGRALIEGLRGTNLRLDCDERRCLVNLDPLLGYCKERVLSIARESFHEEVDQEVSLSGDYVRDPVTQLPPPQPPPLVLGLKPLVRSAGTEARQFTENPVPSNWRPSSDAESHGIFGSETLTEPFANARVVSFPDGAALQQGKDFVVHRVRHTEDRRLYEVEFSLSRPRPINVVYQLLLPDQSKVYTVTVPSTSQDVRFLLTLEVSRGTGPGDYISRVSLNLGERSEFPYGLIARAWQAYRQSNLTLATGILSAEFIQSVERLYTETMEANLPAAIAFIPPELIQELEWVLRDKVEAPLAAAIAGLLLVKGQVWSKLHDWLGNVARLFPWFSDGAVLWAEQLLRQYPDDAGKRREALDQLLSLDGRTLPLLTEVMALAHSRLLEFGDDLDSLASNEEREKLSALIDRFRTAVTKLRPGGLFTVQANSASAGILLTIDDDPVQPQILYPEEIEAMEAEDAIDVPDAPTRVHFAIEDTDSEEEEPTAAPKEKFFERE